MGNSTSKEDQSLDSCLGEEIFGDWIAANGDEDLDSPIKKRKRHGRSKNTDYWSTAWGIMLRSDEIKEPDHVKARQFRRRFRVPYAVFVEVLLSLVEEFNLFDIKDPSKVRVPPEFKQLMCLLILHKVGAQ